VIDQKLVRYSPLDEQIAWRTSASIPALTLMCRSPTEGHVRLRPGDARSSRPVAVARVSRSS